MTDTKLRIRKTNLVPISDQMVVCWSILNLDLGRHHNEFCKHFPNCLFVRVICSGPLCTFSEIGNGGVALIREEVMARNAVREFDKSIGKFRVQKDSPFLIIEDDVIAFEQYDKLV